jgi:cell wall assembly regulator SMI1
MKSIWNRIETWLAANAPEVLQGLNPPATQAQIASAEAALGVTFPRPLVETFLIHNGQTPDSPYLLDGWEFLSLDRIVEEWEVWKDLLDGGDFEENESDTDGHTVPDWWSPKWIPLTYSGGGDHDCLDLQPGPLGTVGQIIRMWHDGPSREVVAPGVREWLTTFANGLEAGRYILSDEYGGIVERDA